MMRLRRWNVICLVAMLFTQGCSHSNDFKNNFKGEWYGTGISNIGRAVSARCEFANAYVICDTQFDKHENGRFGMPYKLNTSNDILGSDDKIIFNLKDERTVELKTLIYNVTLHRIGK